MADSLYQNGGYLERNPDWHEEDAPWKAGKILAMLARHGLTPGSVADVGCGSGAILATLQPQLLPDCQLTGYDISPQAIALCQPRANARLHFVQGDFTATTMHYDLLLAMDVIEHVEDYFAFLRALRGKSDHAIFHIPLELSAQMALRGTPFLRAREQFGHLHHFNKELALRTLTDARFEIVDAVYTAWATEMAAQSLRSRLARIPRKILFALNKDLAAHLLGGYSLLVLAR